MAIDKENYTRKLITGNLQTNQMAVIHIKNQISIVDILPKPEEMGKRTLPKGIKLKPKEYWCPYCYKPVVFKRDNRLGVLKCPICGISERDYWIRKLNDKIKK